MATRARGPRMRRLGIGGGIEAPFAVLAMR